MSKSKLARALSARHGEEDQLCQKNVLPRVKKLVIGSQRNPPPPRADCAEAGRPCRSPNRCQKQGQPGEGRKLCHPCSSAYLQGFLPVPGRSLRAEVFPSVGMEGNFRMTGVTQQSHTTPWSKFFLAYQSRIFLYAGPGLQTPAWV